MSGVARFVASKVPIHYAWIVAATGLLVILGVVGLARFAFGMILPAMAQDLSLSYDAQGLLGGSYFFGYFAITPILPWLAPKAGARKMCLSGLLVVAVSLFVMSVVTSYPILCIFYFATGVGSCMAFVSAVALSSSWFFPSHRGRGAGIIVAGAGIGITTSGVLFPKLEPALGLTDWQLAWLLFAIANLLFAALTAVLLRNRPEDIGLSAYGTHVEAPTIEPGSSGLTGHWRTIFHIGMIYTLFAATGLTFATFFVTTLIDSFGFTRAEAGVHWAWVGMLSIFSGALFGNLSDRFGRNIGMMLVLGCQVIAYIPVTFQSGEWGIYISVVLFGVSAWGMPTIVAAATGDYLGPQAAAAGFAVLTLLFAAGQALGPAGAGLLAQITGNFETSYMTAIGLNLIAITLCFFLKPPPVRKPAAD